MLDQLSEGASNKMQKSIESFSHELSRVRTGRAHPSLLEAIKVDYYGTETPLTQVANVAVDDARTLNVTPWEKTMVGPIEKAIMKANLGLNPTSAGMVIRVPLPQLTEERRRDLVKSVKEMAEGARIAIRNIRRDANNECKRLLKDKEVSEDESHSVEAHIQKLTDRSIAEVDQLLQEKEKDLMKV